MTGVFFCCANRPQPNQNPTGALNVSTSYPHFGGGLFLWVDFRPHLSSCSSGFCLSPSAISASVSSNCRWRSSPPLYWYPSPPCRDPSASISVIDCQHLEAMSVIVLGSIPFSSRCAWTLFLCSGQPLGRLVLSLCVNREKLGFDRKEIS